MGKMPNLRERMVIKYRCSENSQRYLLVEYVPMFDSYCEGHNLEYNPDRGVLVGDSAVVWNPSITGIYGHRRNDSALSAMPREALERLVVYDNPYPEDVIWEQAVREMTVDEISKELGYPVKIIGNKEI